MTKSNKVFIATSLDGYIADSKGNIDWLHSFPNSKESSDMGYGEFMNSVDALIMGRTTFETVAGFDIPWPYEKPVYVLSSQLKEVPNELKGKVELVTGTLQEILHQIYTDGYHHLYIDGGKTIQSFLREALIDEITITVLPILLGRGIPLFGELDEPQRYACVHSRVFDNGVVQKSICKNGFI